MHQKLEPEDQTAAPLKEKETVHVWHSRPLAEVVQRDPQEPDADSSSAEGPGPETKGVRSDKDDEQAESSDAEQQQHDDEEEGSSSESDEVLAEVLARVREMILLDSKPQPPVQPQKSPLKSLDLEGIAEYIKSGKARSIVVMCGAGISVSAGIPDFRTPGTGLYSKLEQYDIPHPQAIFEIDFFRSNPLPFFTLSRELYPGTYKPTTAHYFIRLLHERGLLRRCYTQNIDSLESAAGLPHDAVVAAHGNFDTAACIDCGREHDTELVRRAIFAHKFAVPRCTRKGCRGLIKPGIVMFGENLPDRFWDSLKPDFGAADLLLVMGTSLVVQPFAGLIDRVGPRVPRLLINRERVGEADEELRGLGWDRGFEFPPRQAAWRDVLELGDCDEGVWHLARLLGWEDDLRKLVQHADADAVSPIEGTGGPTVAEADSHQRSDGTA